MEMDDVPDVREADRAEKNCAVALNYWQPRYDKYVELKKAMAVEPESPSILMLFAHFGWDLFISQIYVLLQGIFQFAQPYILQIVLERVAEKAIKDVEAPIGWFILLALTPFLIMFFEANGHRYMIYAVIKLRAMLCSMLYAKTLRLNLGSDSGFLITLISSDCRQASEKLQDLLMFPLTPFKIVLVIALVARDIGVYSLIALGVIIFSMPFQILATQVMIRGYRNYLQSSDSRMKITNESLQGMRVIKYGGLEEVFKQRIQKERKIQLDFFEPHFLGLMLMFAIMHCLFILVSSVTLSCYIFGRKIPQEDIVLKVFPNAQMLMILNFQASFVPQHVQNLVLLVISLRRIRTFLLLDERVDYVAVDAAMTVHVDVDVDVHVDVDDNDDDNNKDDAGIRYGEANAEEEEEEEEEEEGKRERGGGLDRVTETMMEGEATDRTKRRRRKKGGKQQHVVCGDSEVIY